MCGETEAWQAEVSFLNTKLVWVQSLPLSPRLSYLPTLISQVSGWGISGENGDVFLRWGGLGKANVLVGSFPQLLIQNQTPHGPRQWPLKPCRSTLCSLLLHPALLGTQPESSFLRHCSWGTGSTLFLSLSLFSIQAEWGSLWTLFL